ncbi:MAG: DegT/DnrJ/EryC1/StrS family aminotransferase [Flavobacteriaceae bacterium]|nr:DegT/DnrJ/EryC1/StrS family aminotransferase [Flavobacteriaceae bacterium]
MGVKHAIGLNSATAALHIALTALNLPKGKKVLVPSLTFASTACAVLYNGLVPVFVDSDPITLGMDLADMKRKYDKDCVAVMPVHFTGHPVPMDELMPWARGKNLKVIEDCAHTTGMVKRGTPTYKGKALGTWGDFGCYSFEEKKLMTTGDGGMIVSNNDELVQNIKAYRWVGIDKDNWKTAQSYVNANKDAMHWFYEINVLGYKYNMNDLSASIGLAQLKKLDKMNARRSQIIERYMRGIEGINGVIPIVPFDVDKYVYQMFGIRAEKRDELMIFLKSKGIATGCHYTPLTRQPLFKPYAKDCSYIEQEADKFITLPLHYELTDEEVDYIIKYIKEFYA